MTIKAVVTEAHLKDSKPPSLKELEQAVESILKWCRKRDVDWVKARLTFDDILIMPIEVYDRGKRMQVDVSDTKRKTYAFDTNGIILALGDLIREKYQGKSTYLDILQNLLGLSDSHKYY